MKAYFIYAVASALLVLSCSNCGNDTPVPAYCCLVLKRHGACAQCPQV